MVQKRFFPHAQCLLVLMVFLAACQPEQPGQQAPASEDAWDISTWIETQRTMIDQAPLEVSGRLSFDDASSQSRFGPEKAREKMGTLFSYMEDYDLVRPEVRDRYALVKNQEQRTAQQQWIKRRYLKPGSKGQVSSLHLYFDQKAAARPVFLFGIQQEDNYLYSLERKIALELDARGRIIQARIFGWQQILWFDRDPFDFAFEVHYPDN